MHSFCFDYLRQHGKRDVLKDDDRVDSPSDAAAAETDDRWQMLQRVLKVLALDTADEVGLVFVANGMGVHPCGSLPPGFPLGPTAARKTCL